MASLASGTKTLVVIAEESTAYTTENVPAESAVGISTIVSDLSEVITVTTSTDHGYKDGDRVTFSIEDGDAQDVLEGNDYYVDVTSTTEFVLYTDRKLRKAATDLGASEAGALTSGTGTPEVTRKSLEEGYEAPRVTGRAVNLEKNLLESEEVRASRMQRDVRHGFTTASASIGFEWVAGGQEVLIDSVLDSITAETAVASAITVTGAIGDVSGLGDIEVGDGDADNIKVGDLLVFYRNATGLITGSAAVLEVDTAGGAPDTIKISERTPLKNQGASTIDFVVAKKNEIGSGIFKTYTIERQFTDLATPQYEPFYGMVGNSLSVTISPESIAGGTVEFVGTGSGEMGATSQNGASEAHPVSTNSPFAAFDGAIFESGSDNDIGTSTAPVAVVTSIDFTVNNNRTSEARVGSKFSPCVFDATCQVEGTLSVFFDDKTLYNKFVNETETSILIHLTGAAATDKTYASIYFPRVKFNGATIDPPAEGAVTMEIPFRALEGSAGESAVTISTFDSEVTSIDV